MTLKVTTPEKLVFEGAVEKVVVDGVDGSRGLLPLHVDFVMPLKPGIMACTDEGGVEKFIAVNGGVLVKKGAEVTVASRHAVMSDRLEDLPDVVLAFFAEAEQHVEAAQRAALRLETMLMREFLELKR